MTFWIFKAIMTRYANVGLKRTYLQAGFDAQGDGQDPSPRDVLPMNASGEASPKKRKKREFKEASNKSNVEHQVGKSSKKAVAKSSKGQNLSWPWLSSLILPGSIRSPKICLGTKEAQATRFQDVGYYLLCLQTTRTCCERLSVCPEHTGKLD